LSELRISQTTTVFSAGAELFAAAVPHDPLSTFTLARISSAASKVRSAPPTMATVDICLSTLANTAATLLVWLNMFFAVTVIVRPAPNWSLALSMLKEVPLPTTFESHEVSHEYSTVLPPAPPSTSTLASIF
jgi:hypothetical protein